MRESIYADIENYNYGTAFYAVTEDLLKQFYNDSENPIMQHLVNTYGFDAFDIDTLYGSEIIDGVLYVCDTNGSYIDVNGEEVDPESALESFTLDELSDYIIDADESIIKRYLTEHELAGFDLDDVAYDMIHNGYAFSEVAKWADKMDLLQDIIY